GAPRRRLLPLRDLGRRPGTPPRGAARRRARGRARPGGGRAHGLARELPLRRDLRPRLRAPLRRARHAAPDRLGARGAQHLDGRSAPARARLPREGRREALRIVRDCERGGERVRLLEQIRSHLERRKELALAHDKSGAEADVELQAATTILLLEAAYGDTE